VATEEEIQAANDLVIQAARLVRRIRRSAGLANTAALIRLLSILDELGPSTVTALAEADMTSQPTTTIAVKGLLERGWATRSPHPHDARANLIELTEAGHAQITRTRQANGNAVAARLAPYTVEDLRAAAALLTHLTEKKD
jgi:DNA-binding MarR family transcriptional regulator